MAEDNENSGGGRLKTFFTTLPGILTGLAALLTAIAALAGVFLTRDGDEGTRDGGTETTSAQDSQPAVELLSPQSGRVSWKSPVVVRYSGVGQDLDLWLIERSDKYYPHPSCPGEQPTIQPLPGQESDTWSETIEIGRKDTPPGDAFELLVLLTSEHASQLLSEQIRGWCDMAWPGLSELPEEDSEVKASVSIVR